ncbi:MAG: hypothetical protein GWN67_03360 [Phycisphaerae bacterium]|nr:DUF4190 domain-containing protein [Phycisphaerae bacterium]NIR63887.1 DUF4190 domain-containing protein [candidate division Zixibacteria bacterium]NIP52010.1 DUF4190 domain-containing protein [Phycisphaerae bacterium]NIS53787.1 DUF4190 domain-containing protein [Phycisphaerae bacterium]NIU08745.1 DUF4190 domain-containing protein [Phycisphaerae bacterium]
MEEQTQAPVEPTPSQPQTQQPLAPHRGTMILVFGILSIVCCLIFGIVAWVMASKDLKEMAAGRMDPSGQGITKAGMICGIVGIALQLLGILLQLLGVGLFTVTQA